jgi:putative NIF3 family GTP cyclohydrolase 1 type 2
MLKLRIKEIEDYIERELAPLELSLPQDVNGLLFGTLDTEVTGIIVCWSPTLKVIERAVKNKANLIVSHEWLIYEHSRSKWTENERGTFSKFPNLKRLELLTKHNITVLKHHSNWDIAPGGVTDSFGEFLGFGNPVKRGRVTRVYREKPRRIRDLASEVAEKLGLECVKVAGDVEKEIKYIGTAVGGLGQILTFADEFVDTNAEVLIFGETLEYSAIYTLESGFPFIVTSHEATEKPGMIKLSQLLRRKFPKVNVWYEDSGAPLSFTKPKGAMSYT